MVNTVKLSYESNKPRDDNRKTIVAAAINLLTSGGRDAVTTRAVADAAGVQAPTIYRLFGDKHGLLDAVAEYGFAAYLEQKKVCKAGADPVEELRVGWDLHVEFGLTNPAIYLLMYANPGPGSKPVAAEAALRILKEHIHGVAMAGRLRISEERAANLIHACACGLVLTLLAMAEDCRDSRLSDIAREAAMAAIVNASEDVTNHGVASAAVALRAALPKSVALSDGERALLSEWLDRMAEN